MDVVFNVFSSTLVHNGNLEYQLIVSNLDHISQTSSYEWVLKNNNQVCHFNFTVYVYTLYDLIVSQLLMQNCSHVHVP